MLFLIFCLFIVSVESRISFDSRNHLDDYDSERTTEFEGNEAQNHAHGFPIDVVKLLLPGNQTLSINNKALNDIFLHSEVANRKIVAVSVGGFLRKDKKILLDYFLRFMYANVSFANLHDSLLMTSLLLCSIGP
jgi:hypothetical protein